MMFKAKSSIHGRGCFTDCYLRPGTNFDVPSYQTNVATWTAVTWIDEVEWWELYSPYCFINHSENANAELYLAEDGSWNLYILRAVKKNEEITIDYGDDWVAARGD
jgi:hypothetical protein